MDRKRQGHVPLYGCLQEADQILKGCIFVMMATATGIRHFIHTARLLAFLWGHEPEGVAEGRSGLSAHHDPGHVAAHTVGKRVDGMGVFVRIARMTAQALSGPCPHGLELGRGQAQLMDIVTGGTGDPFLCMYRFLPVIVLSMVTIHGLIRVKGHQVFALVRAPVLVMA